MLKTKAILHRKDEEIRAHDCEITKVVELDSNRFQQFQRNLLHDYDFIAENADAMRVDENGVSHCLLVLGEGHEDGILVRSGGYDYARYSALLPHARSILAQQSMSQTLAELNQKLMTFAKHAAMEADRRLAQEGRAELPLGDMGHRFDLDIYDNKTLWDTAASMVAEHLNAWDLEFDIDKNMLVLVDYDVQNIIGVCEKKIPFDPLVAPSDQRWGVRRVGGMDELLDKFEHETWSARTGFVLDDLAFVQQIDGGDEWLSLKRDGDTWHSFDSISFGHMIEQSDVDYCRGHLEYLAAAPAHVLIPPSEPTLTPTM